jgi:hypothetical protein
MSDLEKMYREMMSEPMVIHPDPAMDLFGKYQTHGTVTGRIPSEPTIQRIPMGDLTGAGTLMNQQSLNAALFSQRYGYSTGRQLGKSKLMSQVWQNKYRRQVTAGHPMYIFHHVHGYRELAEAQLNQAPNHCYFLWRNQWYQKGKGNGTRKAIYPDKVPKEHRLFLKINHIKQPGD